jgi:hypothetical protein
MTDNETPLERALRLSLNLFVGGAVEFEEIEQNADDVLGMLTRRGEDLPGRMELIRAIEANVAVRQERSTSLEDRTGHEDWLAERQSEIQWGLWARYRRYLEDVELLPRAVIGRLDDTTFRVLEKLESPERQGEWDRRGMVVGHVQSGKTSHYTSLACKAADAGYKLIVVLAGMHNSLRSQTQLRLDEGLLGFDSQFHFRADQARDKRIGVGSLQGAESILVGSLTDSTEQGDFKKNKAQRFAIPIGSMPVLLVVKKNGSILKNLYEWVTRMQGEQVDPETDEWRVYNLPLLVIDDEADNGSVNTKTADDSPTIVNQRIRTLLKSFDKSAYVGYTATPYANIYSSKTEDEKYGMDLFPRHFIENLKAPSNYFGPTRVFGLESVDAAEAKDPLPIFRPVSDYTTWMPDRHKKDWQPDASEFPASLKKAVMSFFLVCAARRARGQATKHNSMLIHTTRFQLVQGRVAEQVEELLTMTRYRLRYGDGEGVSAWDELRDLWVSDFATTSGRWDEPVELMAWEDIKPHVAQAIDKIQLRVINGDSQDALEYYENRRTGLSVIAIGGDKLSRGLTLEGLSVSYYLRATKMYDTLMQMGRWFGYRPGYEDLCRLFTTILLRDWYCEITAATEELRASFDDMAKRNRTPEQYGLRVRNSAAGLSVTAPSKMRSAKSITMTFSGDISESVTFDVDDAVVQRNVVTLEELIDRLKTDPQLTFTNAARGNGRGGNYVWEHVGGDVVADFFDGYIADPMALRAKPQLLAGYIRDGLKVGELTEWTVALVTSSSAQRDATIAGLPVGLTTRKPMKEMAEIRSSRRYTIRRIVSPADETIDFTDEQREAAMEALREELRVKATEDEPYEEPDYPRGRTLRSQRSPQQALLLLYVLDNIRGEEQIAVSPVVGFAISFPFSPTQLTASYRVNETWIQQMLSELPDDDEDDDDD